MSKNQPGFVVYGDIQAVVDELSDEQAGRLFRAMISYFISGKAPKFDDILKYVWIPIRQQMDRDKEKYDAKCEKNREKIQKYWDKVKKDTNVYNGIPMNTDATNTNTNTNTDTKTNTNTNTNTNTTTNTNTAERRGGSGCDDDFNLWKMIDADGIDQIYEAYPESGGFLLDEVYADVRAKKKKIKDPVAYVLGYARKVGWDDKANHMPD